MSSDDMILWQYQQLFSLIPLFSHHLGMVIPSSFVSFLHFAIMAAHLVLLISLAFIGLFSVETEITSLLTVSSIFDHTRYYKESRFSHLNSPENLKDSTSYGLLGGYADLHEVF